MGLDVAAALKALAEPNRLRVARRLAARGEVCACDLLDELSVSQPTLSHHMRVLQDAGIVRCRRQGKWCHYTLDAGAMDQLAARFSELADAPGGGDGR